MEHGRRPVARTSFDESRDYDWDVRTFPVFDERETDFPNFVLNTGRSNSIGYGVAAHSSAPEDKPNEQIFGWNPGALSWEKADLFTESLGLFVGPATWLRSKCSTCKRRFLSPTAVKTCHSVSSSSVQGKFVSKWPRQKNQKSTHHSAAVASDI